MERKEKKVSHDEFMGVVFDRNLAVYPNSTKDVTYWKFRDGRLWGIVTQGYSSNSAVEPSYTIVAEPYE